MNLYAKAVAAERAAKIERDMLDHAAGVESLSEQLAHREAQIVKLRRIIDRLLDTTADENLKQRIKDALANLDECDPPARRQE